jgi:two-component system, sensor histidine kinase PdtaS
MTRPPGFFQEAFDAAAVAMLVVDPTGAIVDVNRQLERLFGYSRHELLGRPVELLVHGDAEAHQGHRRRFAAHPETRPMGAGRDLHGRHRDGHQVPVEIGLTPLTAEGTTYVLASIVDITDRKLAREQLQASLAEKEILLKELHHRAKNNLQLIASLLDLASSAPGPEVLAECSDRITSIALVHEQLYQSGTFARIDLKDYLGALVRQVAHTWARAKASSVAVRIEAEDIVLPLDSAIPCGLIVNELLTNAFKHAFPQERGGSVLVRAAAAEGQVSVTVSDDGVGLPKPALRPGGHIGLELVQALTRQLHGRVRFEADHGTRVSLTFGGAAS